ncbi:surfeit locus protein 6-domain-containing protein [Lasiosphaeria miniovina]|uniref:Surfeit locus protein 6-domain-containing protein n=1 Tax=Lasiosphaeria miniovina TaxID=1954250 RepID=A0AA40DRM2_9PEZI|nr:surfeit locus protein 6-domain-containing protein [Lasiosphaeria miniovina]KAK0713015.1 surfeit locus protein 6-domain-containing protein [Lasiosphaeria miniovina]
MADTSLQDRLREHAMAFDGLLSLIPAKMYYGEDTSDQWKKKKQSKEEAKAAKRGKLDPDSELNRNAKEVLDERARNKRKLRELEADEESSVADEDEDDVDIPGVEREKPGEGLKRRDIASEVESAPKKQKLVKDATQEPSANKTPKKSKSAENAAEGLVEIKTQSKEEKKLAKKLLNEEKRKAKAEKSASKSTVVGDTESGVAVKDLTRKPRPVQPSTGVEDLDVDDMAPIDVSGLVANEYEGASVESVTGSTPQSPIFDSNPDNTNAYVEVASTTTSISSTITPSEKLKYLKLPADISGLRARLDAKIEALRAARKATDADGTPIRTREELIESRRRKQAQRREHKQELRRAAKEEEDRKREEALTSSRNSPNSMLSPLFEQDDKASANHFAFGRLAFADGTQLSHDLSYEKPAGTGAKKKGPSDPKTALLKFEAQKKRIEALDDDKRKEVLEKETWLAARRRAEGEKVHDDEGLLKKALKRKETAKRKSEREWSERAKGVEDAIKNKQHKREQNIRKRREDKMSSGKGKKKGVATKKKSRPGFEGSFGGKKK